jgi:hypothetical protein
MVRIHLIWDKDRQRRVRDGPGHDPVQIIRLSFLALNRLY